MLQPRARSLGWIVAPSYDLADRAFRLVAEIIETRLKHRIREISTREQHIVILNLGGGVSEVRGKSADRPASLLGEGLEWLVVDEAAQLGREVWESHLSQRLIDKRGCPPTWPRCCASTLARAPLAQSSSSPRAVGSARGRSTGGWPSGARVLAWPGCIRTG